MDDCFTYGGQKVKMPEEGENILEFKDIAKQLKHPFTIYADFECILTKVEDKKNKKTKKMSRHDISGYGYVVLMKKPNSKPTEEEMQAPNL